MSDQTLFAAEVPRRVFITGASRGLGLELARQCLERGDLVFAGARDPDASTGLADLRATFGRALTPVRLDITSQTSMAVAVGHIASYASGLDLLINNAGINAMSRDIEEVTASIRLGQLRADVLTTMFQVNAVGPLMVAQSALTLLRHGQLPRLINISSWMASIAQKDTGGNYGYCASKAALNMFTRTLAHDLGAHGITVVAVDPGWVQTDMGGPNAELTAERSASGILELAEGLTSEQAGAFLRWDGHPHPW